MHDCKTLTGRSRLFGVEEERARALLGSVPFGAEDDAREWVVLLAELDEAGIEVPTRTVDAPLTRWLRQVQERHRERLDTYEQENRRQGIGAMSPLAVHWERVVAAVECGMSLGDMALVDWCAYRKGPVGALKRLILVPQKVEVGYGGLPLLADLFPGLLTVRSAVAWLVLADQQGARDILSLVDSWRVVGLVEDGWRYAAAGLSPSEAAAALGDGSLTSDGVAALAGLRDDLVLPSC